MANYLTESSLTSGHNKVQEFPRNTINRNHQRPKRKLVVDLAPRFKYKINFPQQDIEQIRKLLTLERESQTKEEFDFWKPDYERMLEDDWLVSRFLLRGLKASRKLSSSKIIEDENNNLCDDKQQVFSHTMHLIKCCAKFRKEYRVNRSTRGDSFPVEWIQVNGLFAYLPDLAGNPTIYLRCSLHKPKLIESKEARHEFKRYLLYTLERCDQELFNNMGKGVCCIFDMSEATFENVDLELVSWMIKSFKNCSPKLLAYVIVYNLPWFFSATFKLLTTTLMSNSNKQCLKFVYGAEILQYIDVNNLPPYIKDIL